MKNLLAVGLLAAGLSGCVQPTQTASEAPAPIATPVVALVSSPAPTPHPEQDYFGDAVEKALRANEMSKGAVSNDDWALVVRSWQQSIDLLKQVPKTSANYAKAQTKLKEYSTVLASAKTKAGRSTSLPPVRPPSPAPSPQVQPSPVVVAQPIAQKPQPLAPVTVQDFMEEQYFTETIGRGGSGQGYWCQEYLSLESSLFAPRSYEILNVHTAPNGRGGSVTARIESSNRGGQPVIANWSFAVMKGQTVSEYEYKKDNSPVTAEVFRKQVGGWCLASVFKK